MYIFPGQGNKLVYIIFSLSTHPDIAPLVTPLYASAKRGFLFYTPLPSFRRRRRQGGPAKRRPGESFISQAIPRLSQLLFLIRLKQVSVC